jgi:hypothetical protein
MSHMYVCFYAVCVCVCVCVSECVRLYKLYVCVCIYVRMHTNLYIHTDTHLHTQFTQVYIYIYIHTYKTNMTSSGSPPKMSPMAESGIEASLHALKMGVPVSQLVQIDQAQSRIAVPSTLSPKDREGAYIHLWIYIHAYILSLPMRCSCRVTTLPVPYLKIHDVCILISK